MGNIGESQAYLLQVVDPDYLEDQYAREVRALRDVTDRLRGRQESVRKDLEDSQEQFLLGGKMDRDAAALLLGGYHALLVGESVVTAGDRADAIRALRGAVVGE